MRAREVHAVPPDPVAAVGLDAQGTEVVYEHGVLADAADLRPARVPAAGHLAAVGAESLDETNLPCRRSRR